MPKMRDFEVGDVLPESFLDALNEVLASTEGNLVLDLQDATTVLVPASTGSAQVTLGIGGLWRWNTADTTATGPGGAAATHTVWAVGSANVISGGDVDTTDYSFGVKITTGAAPTGTHNGLTITVTRKLGTATWDGTKYTSIQAIAGVARSPSLLTAQAATITPLRVRGAGSQSADLFAAEDSAGATLAKIAASGQVTAPSYMAGGVTLPASIHGSGTFASRPAIGTVQEGVMYWATDTKVMYRATGGAWVAQVPTVGSADITDLSIVNGDISASAAIAYSKLNLSNSIVSGDVAPNTLTAADVALGAFLELGAGGTSRKVRFGQTATGGFNGGNHLAQAVDTGFGGSTVIWAMGMANYLNGGSGDQKIVCNMYSISGSTVTFNCELLGTAQAIGCSIWWMAIA